MRTSLMALCLFLTVFSVSAQNTVQKASVEKSIFGVQTGFLGIWLHNESKLTNSLALRSEIGFDSGIYGGSVMFGDETNFFLTPVITIEPRWYYNLEKRLDKEKSIDKNSGNFIGLKISFNPDLFVISNQEGIQVPNQIFIIPKWAMKRTLGEHFTYELGIGIGYHHVFYEIPNYHPDDENEAALDLHLRIGYTF